MEAAAIDPDLERHLAELEARHGTTVAVGQVHEVVQTILTSLAGDISAVDLKIYQELEGLASYIAMAKAEIVQLRPEDIPEQYIPSATDELDAIVAATETATNSILDACEAVEQVMADLPPSSAGKLSDATTRIYEACNFQDITGQRITKVVKALKHIETKVDELVTALGGDKKTASKSAAGTATGAEDGAPLSDQDLLNGPQLPDTANSQADIDALFAGLD